MIFFSCSVTDEPHRQGKISAPVFSFSVDQDDDQDQKRSEDRKNQRQVLLDPYKGKDCGDKAEQEQTPLLLCIKNDIIVYT